MNVSDMNFSAWSTATGGGEAADDKINTMKISEKLTGFTELKSSAVLNESKVPSWDHAESWVQAECFKPASFNAMTLETDSCNSGSDGQPAWACTDLSEPAWASSESSSPWDHDKATKLAEQLLQVQFDDTSAVELKQDAFNSAMAQQLIPRPMHSQLPQQLAQHEMNSSGLSGMANPRFKTEFCRNFREKGECVYGSQCQFAHGKVELRHDVVRHSKYKTKLCQKYWINGWCAYGTRCNFIHQEEGPDRNAVQPTTQSGFRPLTGAHNFRKSSESSVDSGIDKCSLDSGVLRSSSQYQVVSDYKPKQEIGSGWSYLQSGFTKFQDCFAEPKMHKRDEMKLNFSSDLNRNISLPSEMNRNLNTSSEMNRNLNLASEMNRNLNTSSEMNRNMNLTSEMNRNMNLTSEMNRNLYLDIVKVKENRVVPHPEHNPIPASQYLNTNDTSSFRMNGSESVVGNVWTY